MFINSELIILFINETHSCIWRLFFECKENDTENIKIFKKPFI